MNSYAFLVLHANGRPLASTFETVLSAFHTALGGHATLRHERSRNTEGGPSFLFPKVAGAPGHTKEVQKNP